MSKENVAATSYVAAVLSGLALLGFLESLSAVKRQQQQLVPVAFAQTKHHTRRKPLKNAPATLNALSKLSRRSVGRPLSNVIQFPRHVFALPTLTPLPSQPGLFDGSEIVHRLLALQQRQPWPNYECKRTISCSTYLRRLFVCAEMSRLFPNPDERGSWQGPPPPPLAAPGDSFRAAPSGLCAAALAPLSANALAAHFRVQETVVERSFRQKRAAEDEDAAAAAASSSSPSSTMMYEALPVLDVSGRAFCVLIEWERSVTSKGFVRWKGRISKGWDVVCAANRILEGHTISLRLWLEGGGSGPAAEAGDGGSWNGWAGGPGATGGGGQRKLSFIVVAGEGDDGGLLSGYGGGGRGGVGYCG